MVSKLNIHNANLKHFGTRYVPRNMGMPPACKVCMSYIFHAYTINKITIYKYIPNKNQIVYVCHQIKVWQLLNIGKFIVWKMFKSKHQKQQ